MKKQLAIHIFAVIVFSSGFVSPVNAQVATEQAYKINIDPNVDEQLYLIRRLDILLGLWPTKLDNSKETSQKLASLRRELGRANEYAKTKKMDDHLVGMFADSIEMLDGFSELLTDLGAIDRDHYQEAVRQSMGAGVDSFTNGFGAGGALAVAGVEPFTATIISGGLAIKQALNQYRQQGKLENARNLALEKRTNKYLNERSGLIAKIQVRAGTLAEKNKWKSQEVGFDMDEQESLQFQEAIIKKDFELL